MSSQGLAGETETFVRVGITDRFEAGFGYLWRPKVVRPLASYTLLWETERRPSLTAGVLADSLGGGREGVHLSLARDLRAAAGISGSLYLGTAYISNESGPRAIAGFNYYLSNNATASIQFDGRYGHVGATVRIGSMFGAPVRIGLVAARLDRLGPLFTLGFPLR